MRRAAGGGRTRWARGLAAAGAIARASASAALVAGATMLGMLGDAGAARAVVLSVEIAKRTPVLEGKAFGEAGAYELIEGIVHFGFDPQNEANARVTDIALAPRNEKGLVEADADFVVVQPVDPAKRRGIGLFDVPNRGRRLGLAAMNRVPLDFMAGAGLDPTKASDWGDGFLMEQGLSILWVGWQADVPKAPGMLGLRVPVARQKDGSKIRGLARSDWVVDAPVDRLALAVDGHLPIPAADPGSSQNVLTRRRAREGEREVVPRRSWQFDATRTGIVAKPLLWGKAKFEAGFIYELVYVAEDPPLVGLGFAAYRDFASFALFDGKSPFAVKHGVADGSSQSGRFLRHLLYEGFHVDEAGRSVFEGVIIRIGGAGRGGFNHRFAQPGRVGNPFANFFYPGDELPFTSRTSEWKGRRGGLLDRARATGALPRIFQINGGYEYWGRAAALIHMTADGSADVDPLENERLYHVAGAPHLATPFPPPPETAVAPGLYRGSAVDSGGIQRALLVRMLEWIESDEPPPPSNVPTIAAGTLVDPGQVAFPLTELVRPRSPHVAYPLDFGPNWPSGIIDFEPPKLVPPFAIRVPGVDRFGNEATGVRPVELRVPIGTHAPFALRTGAPFATDEMVGYLGSFAPFARRDVDRRQGDRRPSLESLYPSAEAYREAVEKAVAALIEEGFLLPRDRDGAVEAALARWKWATAAP
ncbi:MAG: alpha/beta hydrolase domain-containing protein [Myxococcota bacterium]